MRTNKTNVAFRQHGAEPKPPAFRHDPLMFDMRLYQGRERYPDDGPVLCHLSPEEARYLRVAMGNDGLWHMETEWRRDVENAVANWDRTVVHIAAPGGAEWWERVKNAPHWIEVRRRLAKTKEPAT